MTSKLTRREAIALGAAAGVSATAGGPGIALADAVSTAATAPPRAVLRRATYMKVVGETFRAAGHDLKLVTVGDIRAAEAHPALRGNQAAFNLVLQGPERALSADIHELEHPLIGPFALFIAPVGVPEGGRQTYEITVDQTIPLRPAPAPATTPAGEPKPQEPASAGPKAEALADTLSAEELRRAAAPSERDLEIIEERHAAKRARHRRRGSTSRRARNRLRRAHVRRGAFKRRQAARVRKVRTGWLWRHGR